MKTAIAYWEDPSDLDGTVISGVLLASDRSTNTAHVSCGGWFLELPLDECDLEVADLNIHWNTPVSALLSELG